MILKSDSEARNTQTPAILKLTRTQSIRDSLSFKKRNKKIFKLIEKPNGEVFWNDVLIKPACENRIENRKIV